MFAEEGMVFSHLNITICYTLVFLRTFMHVNHITIILTWELGGFEIGGKCLQNDFHIRKIRL